jgi:SulP family sulfate permease
MQSLKNILPEWIRSYSSSFLRFDVVAGLTVAILLLPQSMAYALLAGLDPVYGIYSIVFALPIYALVGQQKTIAIGPAAMVAILVSSSLSPFYQSGTAEYISAAATLSALSGIFLLILGYFRFGFITNFISRPVISGYSFAVGVLVMASQSKYLLDIQLDSSNIYRAISGIYTQVQSTFNWQLLLISVLALAFLIVSKRINRMFPAPLILMISGIVAIYFLGDWFSFAPKIGAIPSGLPNLDFTFFNLDAIQKLWPSALILAFIIYMDISTVSQVAQKNSTFKGNREMKAMGLANFAGSFINAFPISTSFGRSLLSAQSGAKTPLTSLVAVVVVLSIVVVFKDVFSLLPTFILAAVVISTVVSLVNFKESRAFFRADKSEFVVHVITIISTLTFGIKEGIVTGVIASIALVIYRSSTPHIATLGYLPDAKIFMNVNRFQRCITFPGIQILRPDAQLYHGNVQALCKKIDSSINEDSTVRTIIIQCNAVNFIDSSAIKILTQQNERCNERGVSILFCKLTGPVRDQMKKWDFYNTLGENRFFNDTQSALNFCNGEEFCKQELAIQSNYQNLQKPKNN